MNSLEVNGATLAFEEAGNGDPPFLFVHGWAADRAAWEPQLRDLGRNFRCVAVDLRGRGASPPAYPCDVATAAADLAAVGRALRLGPAIIVGHGVGGLSALLLRRDHPELVLGVVTGDSPLGGGPGMRPGASPLRERIERAQTMEPARPLLKSFFTDDTPAETRRYVEGVVLTCPAEVALGMLGGDEPAPGAWDALVKEADGGPFMAFWAERPAGNPNRLRELTVFLRQEPIAGAGHYFQLERPDITNALLRAFVDDVERDPRARSAVRPA